MGKDKKHKKHKSSKRGQHDMETDDGGHLRLVLKVGGSGAAATDHCHDTQPTVASVAPLRFNMAALSHNTPSSAATAALSSSSFTPLSTVAGGSHLCRKDKKHKKKKKKDRDKDKERHKEKHKKMKRASLPELMTCSVDSTATTVRAAAGEDEEEILVTSAACDTASRDTSDITCHPGPGASHQHGTTPPPSSSHARSQQEPPSVPQQQRVRRTGAGRPAMSVAASDLLCLGADTDERPDRSSLQRFIAYVQRALEMKDPQSFFSSPVTDSLAPGYSSIISQPMDFSTMRQRNDEAQYQDLASFQEDFRLMCANAMVYNRMDTKYYKAAKRLLNVGTKMMHSDKLVCLRAVLPYMSELTDQQLGFNMQEVLQQIQHENCAETQRNTQTNIQQQQQQQQQHSEDVEMCDDVSSHQTPQTTEQHDREDVEDIGDMDHEDVEEEEDNDDDEAVHSDDVDEEDGSCVSVRRQTANAAKQAADKLAQKYRTPPKLGFLRRRSDGTTSLAIITPSSDNKDNQERPVSVGLLSGKLAQGNAHLSTFKEDKRNFAKPVKSLYYGSYCSFAPSYDSTFANLNCQESQLLFQTYTDDPLCQQYVHSLCDFVGDCEPAVKMVDGLLDILTNGQHSRSQQIISEDRAISSALSSSSSSSASDITDSHVTCDPVKSLQALRSLTDIGIDVDFLDAFEEAEKQEHEIQHKLNNSARLISSLHNIQHHRLSQTPTFVPTTTTTTTNNNNVPSTSTTTTTNVPCSASSLTPSSNELQLAGQLRGSLGEMMLKNRPGDLCSTTSVRRAMGVGILVNNSVTSSSQEEVDVEHVPSAAIDDALATIPAQPAAAV